MHTNAIILIIVEKTPLRTHKILPALKTKKDPPFRMSPCLAAGEGFEPSQTESESGVLPLHKPAKRKSYYTRI